jgi:Domain of unknown function (DUF4833)
MRRGSRHLLIMLSRRALPLMLAAAAVESYAPRELQASPSRELFTLGRSKNANVVKYAVRLGRDGHLDLAAPVEAYWLMLAEDGRREELSWTERQLAYGFSVSSLSRDGFRLQLAACSKRVLRVSAVQSSFRAELPISGQPASLRRIFVRTDGGLLMPSVRYVEISGLTAAGQSVSERVLPG